MELRHRAHDGQAEAAARSLRLAGPIEAIEHTDGVTEALDERSRRRSPDLIAAAEGARQVGALVIAVVLLLSGSASAVDVLL